MEFLGTLTPDEWETPSLCEGWRVRDVVAHLLYDTIPLHRYLLAAARNGPNLNRLNTRLVDSEHATPPATLLERLSAIDRGTVTGLGRLGPKVGVADMLVHHQDIRRPLGRPRSIDPDRLRQVLAFPDPFAFTRRRTRRLTFVATDLDWTKGEGPEVRGTAESLALAVAGRPVVLDELDGDGVATLRARLARTSAG